MKLYVGNLAFATSSQDLQELFAAAGTDESASVEEDRDTGRSRGFGFVEMSTKEEGEAAIAQFKGKEVNGRALNVNEAKPREKRRGRGGYGGSGGRLSGSYSGRNRRLYRGEHTGGIPVEMSVGEGADIPVQGRAILLGEVTEVKGAALLADQDTHRQVETYFAEIAESRKRSRRVQTEIDRLKKKTQAIIDKLP